MANSTSGSESTVRSSGAAAASADRILQKLRNMITRQEYYEAHQLYRTLYFRYVNSGKYVQAQDLMFEGSMLLLSHQQSNSGADLAGLFLNSLDKDPGILDRTPDQKEDMYRKIGQLFSQIPVGTPERMTFAVSALKLDASRFDVSHVHRNFAIILFREKNFPEARYHFLHSDPCAGEECADLLVQYQISSNSPLEVDLFVTQFILQLLCLRTCKIRPPDENYDIFNGLSLPDENSDAGEEAGDADAAHATGRSVPACLAMITLRFYVQKHPQINVSKPPFKHPLLNFIWLLLCALPTGQLQVFDVLRRIYSPSLNRDPEFGKYLQRIGENYFGLPAQKANRPQGLFGNLLQSLFTDEGSGDDDESDTSCGRESSASRGCRSRAATTTPSARERVTASSVRTHQDEELD